jgi:NADH dehydrogenase
LLAFEEAEREAFQSGRHDPLTFAVIGAGPTGVELAGAIADIARRVVAKEYRNIDTTKARVMLFEAAPKVLGVYPDPLSAKARKQLEELGVEVRTDSLVTDVQAGRIRVADEWIPVRVALWTTGVSASSLGRQLSSEVDRSGRVPVLPDLSLKDHPEVLVLGDLATLKDAKGHVVPGLASAAVQMGSFAGHSILRDLKGQPRHPFVYLDKGTMATIGRNRAVAMIGRFQIAGLVAWLMWGLVHIVLLIGFRNRLSVMWEWIWAYVTGQGNARLITGRDEESSEPLPAREAPKASAR